MALFLVLFAMSSVDGEKFKQMAVALNSEFAGGTGQEEFLSAIDAEAQKELEEAAAAAKLEQISKVEELEKLIKEKEMNELQHLKEKIDKYIQDKNLNLNLKTELTSNGLMITILENALFDSGSAIIKKEAIPLSKEISLFINTTPPRNIMVSGHTDTVPINSYEFSSNWDLSTTRAVNFLELILSSNKKLSPNKFSASGYGEFQPVSDNKSDIGKSKNRRVEVMILPLSNEELKKVYQEEFNEILKENEPAKEKPVKEEVKKTDAKEPKKGGH
jgi:chemotaxis protein MotB